MVRDSLHYDRQIGPLSLLSAPTVRPMVQ